MSKNMNNNNQENRSNNPSGANQENPRDNRENSNNNAGQNKPQNLSNRNNSDSSNYTHGSWDPNDPAKPRSQGGSREPLDSNYLDNRNNHNQNNPYQGNSNYGNYNQSNNGRPNNQQPNNQQSNNQQPNNQQPNNQQPYYRRQDYDYSYNNRLNHYQNYQAPNYVMNQRRDSNTNTIFAVLLAIFITALVTGFAIWSLSTNGILPGTEQNAVLADTGTDLPNPTVPGQKGETVELEGLGLSIHTDDPAAEATANKLAQAIKLLQDNYYSVLSDEEILEAMSEGVLNAMDSPYTYYLTAEEVREFNESIQGNYSGIGASVRLTELGQFEVAEVFNNSPAQEAGLQNGDIIIAVDGRSVSDFETVQELAQTVRGLQGTSVQITVNRLDEEMEFSVLRDDVVMEVVQTRMLEDDIGYMYMSDFTVTLPEQFEIGLQELLDQGAEKIVFDMRNNPGGSAASLISVVDSLLDEATIATVRGRDDGEAYSESWISEEGKMVPEDMTYAILINENSASAAELFAGSLRDNLGTVLIGRQSFGKGSGTRTYNLVDGSAANVTVFNYFLPNGDLIEGEGLAPDIETEGPDSEILREKNIYELNPEEDPDLAEAIEYLQQN